MSNEEAALAALIRANRRRVDWSQEYLAQCLTDEGVPMHATGITRLERGQRQIRVAEMFAICRIFGIRPDDLARELDVFTPSTGGDTASHLAHARRLHELAGRAIEDALVRSPSQTTA